MALFANSCDEIFLIFKFCNTGTCQRLWFLKPLTNDSAVVHMVIDKRQQHAHLDERSVWQTDGYNLPHSEAMDRRWPMRESESYACDQVPGVDHTWTVRRRHNSWILRPTCASLDGRVSSVNGRVVWHWRKSPSFSLATTSGTLMVW
jgi:hypothetical protein